MNTHQIGAATGMMSVAGLLDATGSKLGVGYANTLLYAVAGVGYTDAANAETSFPATITTLAAAKSQIILVEIVAGATAITFVAGDIESTSGEQVVSKGLQIPPPTDGACPIGYIKIDNATNPFIFGTTAVDATGVTTTYVDFGLGMPAVPASS
jgi:hypothetical protein